MSTRTDRPITVLHVDDEPDFAELTAIHLERRNAQLGIITARDVSHGLRLLDEEEVDCIISDYEMTGRNGIDFLEAVRGEHPSLPFILFTGKGSEEVASTAISAGVSDYLQKELGSDQYTVLANRVQNLVEKHRAEQLVDRAFRAMDRAREGMALLDEGGHFLYVNRAYCDILGYTEEELIGTFWEVVYPDGQVSRVHEKILDQVPAQGHWTGETVYRRKDGTRILVSHALTYSEDRTMICLLRELDDDEPTAEALHRERQRFDLLVDAIEEYAIFMLDPDGYIISWNRGAEQIKGYSEDEILGEHFSIFYNDEQREAGLPAQLLVEALETGAVEYSGPRLRKDGTTFQADIVLSAVYDQDGRHRGFGKVTRDITNQEDRASGEPVQ